MPLYKKLSEAAVANGRTMEEEIVAWLEVSLDSEQEARTNQQRKQSLVFRLDIHSTVGTARAGLV